MALIYRIQIGSGGNPTFVAWRPDSGPHKKEKQAKN